MDRDRGTGGQTDVQMVGWTDIQTGRWRDQQTDGHTIIEKDG